MDAETFPEFLTLDGLYFVPLFAFLIAIKVALFVRLRRMARRKRQRELAHVEIYATIAHEIRQPLTAIVFSAHAAQRYLNQPAEGQPQLVEVLDDIVHYGRHADAVVQRQLAVLRGEPIPFKSLNLNELVADAVRRLHCDLTQGEVKLVLELAEHLPPVRGDGVQLKQVLNNLVRNATGAMSGRVVEERILTVRTFCDKVGAACVAVVDRGTGLVPALRGKLFPPHADDAPDRLGRGLFICRSIIEAHHGTITGANNDDGPGATFTITLPLTAPAYDLEIPPDVPARDHLCGR